MKRLTQFLGFIAAGLRSWDDLIDENDRLAATVDTLRARIIEQQARLDHLEAQAAGHLTTEAVSPSGQVRRWQDPEAYDPPDLWPLEIETPTTRWGRWTSGPSDRGGAR